MAGSVIVWGRWVGVLEYGVKDTEGINLAGGGGWGWVVGRGGQGVSDVEREGRGEEGEGESTGWEKEDNRA
eukprot:762133-Hanusia_phi.AAC.1